MTMPAMTCDEFAARLADFLERDADESTRAALESHALVCADCGALLADLRALRIEAANLPPFPPPRDLWAGIAQRIEAPVLELPGRATTRDDGRDASARRVRQWAWMSIAAVALIAVSVGTTYYVTMRGRSEQPPTRVAANSNNTTNNTSKPATVPDSVTPVSPTPSAQNSSTAPASAAGEASSAAPSPRAAFRVPRAEAQFASRATKKPSAEEIYGREIARLHAIVAQRRSTLDTATVAVVEKNLRVIDSAIAQCRAALAKDPGSRFLLQSLNGALETKVELLRTAAQLPSHS